MPTDEFPFPGWSVRTRLLAADLVAFDPSRLEWTLALRTTVALSLPLLLAHALGQSQLTWVGLGAYLLAIGDSSDDGDREQTIRIIVGAILGGLALTSGVLAGANLITAIAGMMLWGILAAMMGVYGSAFATMSLPVAWAYVELGLPASDHTPLNALSMGGLFVLGGLWMLVLTLMLRSSKTSPARTQTAICFRELVRYLETTRRDVVKPPEARVRSALAEARRLAAQARQSTAASSSANQRILMLIEVADRLYSVFGAMREIREQPGCECKTALLAIAADLDEQAKPEHLRQLRLEMQTRIVADEQEAASPNFGILRRRLMQELCQALSLAANDKSTFIPAALVTPRIRLSMVISPLLANLNCNSIAARHAVRFALLTSVAVLVFWVFPKPFGYWVPLTTTVVLKPYAGLTLARAVQRILGTVGGILIGLALMPFLPTVIPQFCAVIIMFAAMMAVLRFNYGLAILFLSAGLIPLEHVLTPEIQAAIGADRLGATAIGATLALVGGHVLWPVFERGQLPELLRICTNEMAAYSDTILSSERDLAEDKIQSARRQAGLSLSNLQAGIQRALTEIGPHSDAIIAILQASIALQRLSGSLNMLLHVVPSCSKKPSLEPFRAEFVPALSEPKRLEPSIAALRARIAMDCTSPEAEILSYGIEHLLSALQGLRDAFTLGDPNNRAGKINPLLDEPRQTMMR